MTDAAASTVASLIERIPETDAMAAQHKDEALSWLARTSDIYRRVKPRTPSPHLVSYFLLVDRTTGRVLLCDHRLSGLWLPTGGHVEPGEHPVETVRREAAEELGIEAHFDPIVGAAPFFLTVTETVGDASTRHTDVSLWFALEGRQGQPLVPDGDEFVDVRWWARSDIEGHLRGRQEPHLLRALDALGWDA